MKVPANPNTPYPDRFFSDGKAAPRCYRAIPRLGSLLIFLLALLPAGRGLAQVSDTACIQDATGLNHASCTANDVRVASMDKVEGPDSCVSGERIEVKVRARIESGPRRYDIGLWIDQGGGDAKSAGNICYRDYLSPVSPDNADVDLSYGLGPYYNGEADSCGDVPSVSEWGLDPSHASDIQTCSDGNNDCVVTYREFWVPFVCGDYNGDGKADVGACSSWDNNSGEGCLTALDTNPGTGSKCNCGFVQVGDIDVYEEGTIEVRKVVLAPNGGPAPQEHPGLFNLRIDGEDEFVDASDGDTSGPVTVGAGTSLHPGATHVVDETAGTGTDLASYTTSISCDNGESCEDCPSLDVTVEPDSDVVCTITNQIECPDCDDGEYCNGEEECDEATGQCVTNPVPDCDDGLECTVDSCNEDTDGCDHAPEDALCDNGLYCDGPETCDAVLGCQAGTPPNCMDEVSCTVDSCNEDTDGCDRTPDDALCDNGLYCDGPETCHAALGCQAGAPPNCDDGVGCTVDSCDENSDRCDNMPDDGICDNGVFCDGPESCNADLGCQEGKPPTCDDGVYCTDDRCDSELDRCMHEANESRCDDGRLCTDKMCVPEDPLSAPSGCLFTFDATNDPSCELEICRTGGFWGTHSLLIEELLILLEDSLPDGFTVCDAQVDNILVNWEASAVEGLCNRPKGDMSLITARQLLTASLNCILTAGYPYCGGTSAEGLWTDLNLACSEGNSEVMAELEPRLDCWNNGGDLSLYDTYGCVIGLCSGIPGEFCGGDWECEDDPCVLFADSCHAQPLVNPDIDGFDFETGGQWVDSKRCSEANKTRCTLPYIDDCLCPGHPTRCGED